MSCAELDGGFEVGTHAHAQGGQTLLASELCEKCEMDRRLLLVRGNAHEASDLDPQLVAAEGDEGRQLGRGYTRLLRLLAGVDFDEQLEVALLAGPGGLSPKSD